MIISKKQLGFAIPLVILIVAILIVAGGSGYYFYKSLKKETVGIFLKMDKTTFNNGETIEALVESKEMLFTSFPAFGVYQLVKDEWRYIDIYDLACALSCQANEKDICTESSIACAPLPEHCQDFDPFVDKFSWDQSVLKTRKVECPNLDETRFCSFYEMTEPGKYKVVFQCSENCANEDLFLAKENNVQKIEKEFEIK